MTEEEIKEELDLALEYNDHAYIGMFLFMLKCWGHGDNE